MSGGAPPGFTEGLAVALRSKLFAGDARLEAAAQTHAQHITQGARGPHVGKIQTALVRLDSAKITVDQIYGPATANAVLAYKQKRNIVNQSYQQTADNVVGIMTMAALDEEMLKAEEEDGTVPIVSRSQNGTCKIHTQHVTSPGFATDPDIVLAVTTLLVQVRWAIQAAEFHVAAAAPHVTNRRGKLPDGPFTSQAQTSIKLLDKVFGLLSFDNQRSVLETIRVVYYNMRIAIRRSFETDPLIAPVLFVPNPQAAMERIASGYTSAGGAYKGSKEKLTNGLPANRIYICNNNRSTTTLCRVMLAIHELAHYVSNGKGVFPITDPLDGFYFDPADGPNLFAKEPTVSAKAKRMLPVQKIRDADHYAAFAVLATRHGRFQ
jgi:peptidoglycan hydrolase-like protein with peptidoglycan-binding domain